MREVKFRVWDKKMSFRFKMSKPFNPFFFGGVFTAKAVFMQFTGLSDTNGREVYEDDLLGYWVKDVDRNDKLLLCRVMFNDGSFSADISCYLNGRLFTELKPCLKKYTVVGNIYENPELLEMEKIKLKPNKKK